MKTKILAMLCALLALCAPVLGDTLDLSRFDGGEPPEAAAWE